MVGSDSPDYSVYVLRFWEERGGSPNDYPEWRYCLEEPGTGKRYGFPNLQSLIAFLEQATAGQDESRTVGDDGT